MAADFELGYRPPNPYITDMTDEPSKRTPESPRNEPEIIPPGGDGSPWAQAGWPPDPARAAFGEDARAQDSAVFITVDEEGRTRYRTFTPPGPFTIGLVIALVGLVGAAILLLALGFILFLIPVLAVAVAALVLSGRVRSWWRRLARH
jgi:hypothetical protein